VNTDRRYFENMYASDADPWGFETSWYERRKYDLTVAALPEARFRSAFEPGCSIGVLSRLLAARCDRLLSTDIIPSALEQARARLRPYPHVRLEHRAIPEQWPLDTFDLIVLSEIAYYFDAVTLRAVIDLALTSMADGATLIAVHWRGVTDYPLSGDATHDILDSHLRLTRAVHHREPQMNLDVWKKL
jgi:hypothetical protein